MQSAPRPDGRDRTVLFAVLEPTATDGRPGRSFQEFVRVDESVFDGRWFGGETLDRRPLHVGDDFEHVSRVPFYDRQNRAVGCRTVGSDPV